jgi:hypothetical protein
MMGLSPEDIERRLDAVRQAASIARSKVSALIRMMRDSSMPGRVAKSSGTS